MFGDRLKLARKRAGYSLRGLADEIGNKVSAQAIGRYERGEMMPSSDVLLMLSRSLHVSLEFLLSDQVEELNEVEYRKLASTNARERARVEAEVIDLMQRYLSVEEILELDSAEWRVPRSIDGLIRKEGEGERIADRLRKKWSLGSDPIPNMTSLLEERGIKVLLLTLPNRVSGLTCLVKRPTKRALPVIVVNRGISLERRRLTLAHELGHRLIDEKSPVDHEKAATVFAGALLVPREDLESEIGKHRKGLGYQELVQLKRKYRVSAAALLVRLHQVEIIDQSTLAYAFQTFAKGWRKQEPSPLEPEKEQGQHEVPRRFERLCYRALAEQLISPGKVSELLRKPLKEIEHGMKGPPETDADHH